MTDRPPPDDCGKCFDEGFKMGQEAMRKQCLGAKPSSDWAMAPGVSDSFFTGYDEALEDYAKAISELEATFLPQSSD